MSSSDNNLFNDEDQMPDVSSQGNFFSLSMLTSMPPEYCKSIIINVVEINMRAMKPSLM